MESMMTARQVAELLGVHENWVYDQAANGALPSYKIGGARRFDVEELRRWIAEHRERERRGDAPPPRALRGANVSAAARRGSAGRRRERGTPEPDQRKREGHRMRSEPVDESDREQPTLFDI